MKKVLVPLFCLLLLPSLPAYAEFKKDECALIERGKITRGICTSDRFYSKGFDATVLFNKKKYTITVMDCSNPRVGACKITALYKDNDIGLNTDAIEQYRDNNLRLTKNEDEKFKCFKRKKSTKNPYELCILR